MSVGERIFLNVRECAVVTRPDATAMGRSSAEYLDVNEINSFLTVPILMESSWGKVRCAQEYLTILKDLAFSQLFKQDYSS